MKFINPTIILFIFTLIARPPYVFFKFFSFLPIISFLLLIIIFIYLKPNIIFLFDNQSIYYKSLLLFLLSLFFFNTLVAFNTTDIQSIINSLSPLVLAFLLPLSLSTFPRTSSNTLHLALICRAFIYINLFFAILGLLGLLFYSLGISCPLQISSFGREPLSVCVPFGQLNDISNFSYDKISFLSRLRLYSWYTEPAVAGFSFAMCLILVNLYTNLIFNSLISRFFVIAILSLALLLTQSTGVLFSALLSLITVYFVRFFLRKPNIAFNCVFSFVFSSLLVFSPLAANGLISHLIVDNYLDNPVLKVRLDSVLNRLDIYASIDNFPLLAETPTDTFSSYFQGSTRQVNFSSLHKYLQYPGMIFSPFLVIILFFLFRFFLAGYSIGPTYQFAIVFPIFMSLSYSTLNFFSVFVYTMLVLGYPSSTRLYNTNAQV